MCGLILSVLWMKILLLLLVLPLIVLSSSINVNVNITNSSSSVSSDGAQASALFVFGDSLVDNGNNNFLSSIAKSNYYPYGIDSSTRSATGKFSNGDTFVDYLGAWLGLPTPPPFADPTTTGARILGGVNYASAAAGILDETGQHYGQRYSLSQQVMNFETTVGQLRPMIPNLSRYLSKSIAVLVFGSNDYINNYLLPALYPSRFIYNSTQFATLLLNHYERQLLALYAVGLRKFVLPGVGPLGCIPNQLATAEPPPLPGRCVDYVNLILGAFNRGLVSLVNTMNNGTLPGSMFVYGNTYSALGDILNNPARYGFTVVDRGCCGIGRQITCLPWTPPCVNRNQYVFWDAFHPTQGVDAVLAQRAYSGPPFDCHPINVQQLALINFA